MLKKHTNQRNNSKQNSPFKIELQKSKKLRERDTPKCRMDFQEREKKITELSGLYFHRAMVKIIQG